MHHHPLPTCWFLLVLLTFLQTTHAQEQPIKNCHEYCLQCRGKDYYRISNVPIEGGLEVSFQVSTNGTLPNAHIVLRNSIPETDISINQENVTLRYGEKRTLLTLPKERPSLSWISLVLDPTTHPDTLLLRAPHDRINVLQAKTRHTSLVTVSSDTETHLVFNCLSGCIIRTNTSAMIGSDTTKLQLPFTMYLKRTPLYSEHKSTSQSPPVSFLTLTSDGINKTVDASNWTEGEWFRVRFTVKNDNEDEGERTKDGKDGVKEVHVRIPKGSYSIKGLQGFTWTLHCAPEGLTNTGKTEPGNTTEQWETTRNASDNGGNGTEGGTGGSGTGEETSSTLAEQTTDAVKGEGKSGGAGALVVTAWVMAGLALFLVMILAVALCTKTARNSHPQYVHDSQPSVGIIYCKNAYREPEEDSEPESPNELKPPNYRGSGSYQLKECKVID